MPGAQSFAGREGWPHRSRWQMASRPLFFSQLGRLYVKNRVMGQADDALLARLRAEAARYNFEEIRSELEIALDEPDPVLAEVVAGALAKHEHALTTVGLAEARRLVTAMLLADPAARKLLDEARVKLGSGTVRKRSADHLADALTRKLGGR